MLVWFHSSVKIDFYLQVTGLSAVDFGLSEGVSWDFVFPVISFP